MFLSHPHPCRLPGSGPGSLPFSKGPWGVHGCLSRGPHNAGDSRAWQERKEAPWGLASAAQPGSSLHLQVQGFGWAPHHSNAESRRPVGRQTRAPGVHAAPSPQRGASPEQLTVEEGALDFPRMCTWPGEPCLWRMGDRASHSLFFICTPRPPTARLPISKSQRTRQRRVVCSGRLPAESQLQASEHPERPCPGETCKHPRFPSDTPTPRLCHHTPPRNQKFLSHAPHSRHPLPRGHPPVAETWAQEGQVNHPRSLSGASHHRPRGVPCWPPPAPGPRWGRSEHPGSGGGGGHVPLSLRSPRGAWDPGQSGKLRRRCPALIPVCGQHPVQRPHDERL